MEQTTRKRTTKRRIYDFVVGPKFPTVRLVIWAVQVPPAIVYTALAQSVTYVVFLSLAALIESSLTDVVEAWKFEEERDNDGDEPSGKVIGD